MNSALVVAAFVLGVLFQVSTGRRIQTNAMLQHETTCPKSYSQCMKVDGCVYMVKSEFSKLDEHPQLQRHAGKCVGEEVLLADAAPIKELATEEVSGESVRIKTKRAKAYDRFIAVADLCGQGQAWTAAPCAHLCGLSQSHTQCIKQRGCVYVYAQNKVSQLPKGYREALEPTFGNCIASNGLIGSSPVGSAWSVAAGNATDEGIVAKATDPQTNKAVKMVLKFPEEPELELPEGIEEEPCVEGVDATPVLSWSPWPSAAARKENLLQACRCSYWRHVERMGKVSKVHTDYQYAKQSPSDFLQVEYGCWRNVLSNTMIPGHNKLRMPVQFEYIATADVANHERSDKFSLDESSPDLLDWQPPRWARSDKYGVPYDVGHLVMANHFDQYNELIHATNLMTNVLPQLGNMNRFAWLSTEYITECAREGDDKENVFVIGGCVWNDSPEAIGGFKKMQRVTRSNPEPYKILIPDYCWKILSTPRRGHVAFYIPNTDEARISKVAKLGTDEVQVGLTALSKFVVSVSELEEKLSTRQTPQTFQLDSDALHDKHYKPSGREMQDAGWSLTCDKM